MNLYEILDASSDCTFDILRQNYHRLLLEYHPDKRNSNDLITKKCFKIFKMRSGTRMASFIYSSTYKY